MRPRSFAIERNSTGGTVIPTIDVHPDCRNKLDLAIWTPKSADPESRVSELSRDAIRWEDIYNDALIYMRHTRMLHR